MTIYIVFLLLMAAVAFYTKKEKYGLICILGLFFITIFRAESVGQDTTSYIREGLSAYASGLKTQQFIYAYLSSFINGRSHLLIVSFAVCTFLGIYVSCRKFGVRPAAAFFFFILFEYFNLSLNIARQYAAAGLLLVAYSYMYEQGKKKYLFFLFVILACGFHSTSLVFSLLYLCRYINFAKLKSGFLVAIFATIYLLYQLEFKEYYLTLMHTIELSKEIEAYSLFFDQADNYNLTLGGLIIAISMLTISIYIFIVLRKEGSNKAKIITSLLFVSIVMDLFFSELYGNIGRLRYSVNIINIIAYSYYFFNIKDKYKLFVTPLVFLIYGYNYLHLLMGKAYGTTPYVFDFWLYDILK